MFRFANIEFLWLLFSIPVLAATYFIYTRYKRRQLEKFGDPELMSQLMPNASRVRPNVKFAILLTALTLLIIAAARPQFGVEETEEDQQGIEAMIALDISNSMLAQDVAPDRLERAKQMVSKLVDNMANDRVGLVVFAGETFVQLPITSDYTSAKMFLNAISPDLIRMQGTAIGAALEQCIRGFDQELSDAGRALIIITDGENHEDDAISVAQRAQEAGIRVIVVGIGKPEGTTIPDPATNAYLKDRQGNLVVSKLNEDMCMQIAQAGGGIYVHCDNTNTALRTIQKELENLNTAKFNGIEYKDYNEQFASFALIAVLLLIIDFFIFNRKNKVLSRLDMFGERSLCLALLLAAGTTAFAQKESHDIRGGNSAYRDSAFDKAEVDYRRALDINSDSYAAQYNLGNALYRQAEKLRKDSAIVDTVKYQTALSAYNRAARLADENHTNDSVRYGKAKYNAGNSYFALGDHANAAESYKEALRRNPKDEEARQNLAKLKSMMSESSAGGGGSAQQDEKEEEQEEQEQQEQQEDQMDQETAEQILQALEQDEQRPPQPQGQKRPLEKNW